MSTRLLVCCSLLFLLLTSHTHPLHAQEEPAQTAPNPYTVTPQVINSFTISPNPAEEGDTVTLALNFDISTTGTNRFCLYYPAAVGQLTGFANQATSGLQDVYTHTASLGPGSSVGSCPLQAGFYAHQWVATNVSDLAHGGDILAMTGQLPSGTTGTFTFSFVQFNESAGGILNHSLTINSRQTAPVVYVDPANQCGGNTPCYSSLAAGVAATEAGGVVNVQGTFPAGITIDKNLTLQSATMATIGGTIGVMGNAQVTVRGLNLTHPMQAFTVANGATLTAYANNITALDAPVEGNGHFAHNWWRSYLVQPNGVGGNSTSGDWSKRLGAVVDGYGLGLLGQARVMRLDGTIDDAVVIVSHGREEFRAPFGQATSEDGNTQCSDYYDIFILGPATGSRYVFLPIDARDSCTPTYNARAFLMFDTGGKPDGPGWQMCTTQPTVQRNPSCWYGLSNIVQVTNAQGRALRATLPVEALQYTPFVAANENLLDPTRITLSNLHVGTTHQAPYLPLFTLLLTITTFIIVYRYLFKNQRHRSAPFNDA